MTMTKQVTLPIVEMKSDRFSRFFLLLFFSGFILVFLNIFIWDLKILYVLSIALILLYALISWVISADRQNGILILTEDKININNTEIFLIKEIQDLKIFINGFEGRIGLEHLRSFNFDNGKNNFIQFISHGSKRKYRFLVSFQNYDAVVRIKEKWENCI